MGSLLHLVNPKISNNLNQVYLIGLLDFDTPEIRQLTNTSRLAITINKLNFPLMSPELFCFVIVYPLARALEISICTHRIKSYDALLHLKFNLVKSYDFLTDVCGVLTKFKHNIDDLIEKEKKTIA